MCTSAEYLAGEPLLSNMPNVADTAMQRIALHHIYEYQKGIRPLVLCTLHPQDASAIMQRLRGLDIDYYHQHTPNFGHINLFFGHSSCVSMVRHMLEGRYLHELSLEQDFILGALLGYDLPRQCDRYASRLAQTLARIDHAV